jgi:autotransporter translocation and assembly factor TamB
MMALDITIEKGGFTLITGMGRHVIRDVNMTYEQAILGASLTMSGSGRTEGGGEGAVLNGPFYARMHVTGTYPDVSVRGTVSTRESGYRVGGFEFTGERLTARVRLDGGTVEITGVTVDGLEITAAERGLRLEGIAAEGEVVKEKDGPFMLRDVALSVPRFGEVILNLAVEENGEWRVSSEADSLVLSSENLRRLGDYVPGFLGGWEISGRAKTLLTMGTIDASDRSVAGRVEIDLVNAGFASPDSLYMGQGITGSSRISFRDDIREGFSFSGDLTAYDFGLLIAGLFINLEKRRLSITASGRLNDDGGVSNLAGSVSLPGVCTADVFGDIVPGRTGMSGNLSYRLTVRDLAAAYDIALRNYFMSRIPWLYTGTVSGSLNSQGRIAGTLASPSVSGRLVVTDCSLGFPDIDTEAERIAASLPFSGPAVTVTSETRTIPSSPAVGNPTKGFATA